MLSSFTKDMVFLFQPVLKEIDIMGFNPIEHFMPNLTIEQIERKYVAFTRAKEKYPVWYKVVSEFVNKEFGEMG